MQRIHSVSARALAEFAFEKGDLISSRRSAARMRDGVWKTNYNTYKTSDSSYSISFSSTGTRRSL